MQADVLSRLEASNSEGTNNVILLSHDSLKIVVFCLRSVTTISVDPVDG